MSEFVGDTGSMSVRSAREKCPGSASCRGSEQGGLGVVTGGVQVCEFKCSTLNIVGIQNM